MAKPRHPPNKPPCAHRQYCAANTNSAVATETTAVTTASRANGFRQLVRKPSCERDIANPTRRTYSLSIGATNFSHLARARVLDCTAVECIPVNGTPSPTNVPPSLCDGHRDQMDHARIWIILRHARSGDATIESSPCLRIVIFSTTHLTVIMPCIPITLRIKCVHRNA